MKPRHTFNTLLATALLSAAVTSQAQTWQWQTLLPDQNFAPAWTGYSALIDPFSADPNNPGAFIGCASYASGEGSVLRLDPNPLNTSTYTASMTDADLERVYRLGAMPFRQFIT
jgi:hypothetical protein